MTLLEREPLLKQLGEYLAEIRNSGGRLVLVSGEAGIGKTALVDAFVGGLPRATRVLRGACDPVLPPRPFAPIFDMANGLGEGVRGALASADRDAVFERFLAVVRQGRGSVVVIEDLHWADSATLDLLRVVGRRLPEMPILILATYRGHEIDGEHPLRQMLGDLPPRIVSELPVPALTVEAVAALAGTSGIDPVSLHAATAGNPFFVTEVIASAGTALSATVRDAVGARVGRLSPAAHKVLRAAAVLGARVERELVFAVAEGSGAVTGLQECLAREMLQEQDGRIAFRHELARRAVLDALPHSERAGLHERALTALRSGLAVADAVRLAHHAIEAGDPATIALLVPPAAEQAAGLGAHEEAADYLAVVLALPGVADERSRADLLERYAFECSLSDRIAAARTAQVSAVDVWRQHGDGAREGNGLRALATYMWLGGEGDRAREVAESAVARLEPIRPHGRDLAAAYAKLAQLIVNSAQDDARARDLAATAVDLAERAGDEAVAVHALTTLALAELYPGITTGSGNLEQALRRARAAGLYEDTLRILINLVEAARDNMHYEAAEAYAAEAFEFLRDHEFGLYRHLLISRMAQLALERGRWAAAEQLARDLLAESTRSSQARSRALGVLGLLRARRGEPGAMALLDEALAVAGPGELQEICPLHAARAEAAWLGGDVAAAGAEAMEGLDLVRGTAPPFLYSELSFLAWRTGLIDRLPDGTAEPYLLHESGRHREAARAWAAIASPYRQAEALADSADETDLLDALAILQPLGARVLADRVVQRLRDLGARGIPRGPRPSTRANPAGLTDREVDVLALIRRGARNADIAERLVLSPKTVDHHVSAILRKLRVPDRAAARREADRLDLQDGESFRPD